MGIIAASRLRKVSGRAAILTSSSNSNNYTFANAEFSESTKYEVVDNSNGNLLYSGEFLNINEISFDLSSSNGDTSLFVIVDANGNGLESLNIFSDQSIIASNVTLFPLLRNIKISRCSLSQLDVSNNINLTSLDVSRNNLTSLDLTPLTKLVELKTTVNSIEVLNTSNCPDLKIVTIDRNELTSLDFTNNQKIEDLEIFYNFNLSSVTIVNMPLLNRIRADRCDLSSINLSSCSLLTSINFDRNRLNSLDVTPFSELSNLDLRSCNLTTLDVTQNPELRILRINGNQVGTLDITQNTKLFLLWADGIGISTLDLSQNTELYNLFLESNPLTNIDLSNLAKLDTLRVGNSGITSINISQNPLIRELEANSCDNLESLNAKNGNNTNITTSNFVIGNNPLLTCVLVDDVTYANSVFTSKDSQTFYSDTSCPI
jgi:hypothetical protein